MFRKCFRLFVGSSFFLMTLMSSISSQATGSNYKNEYFVILKDKPALRAGTLQFQKSKFFLEELTRKVIGLGGKVFFTNYHHAFVGSHVKLTPSAVALLRRDPRVQMIVRNGEAKMHNEVLAVKAGDSIE